MTDLPSGQLYKDHVMLTGSDAISVYNRGYYGRPGSDGVYLTGFEALHLMELSRITVEQDGRSLGEKEVMNHFSQQLDNFMDRYLVYKDLRNRGYVTNQGSGSSFFFRLYQRGDVPKKDAATYYITPLQEGTSINLGELDDLVKLATKSKKELVFGLVDASGDVSYLKVNQLYPKEIQQSGSATAEEWDWDVKWQDYLSWED